MSCQRPVKNTKNYLPAPSCLPGRQLVLEAFEVVQA